MASYFRRFHQGKSVEIYEKFLREIKQTLLWSVRQCFSLISYFSLSSLYLSLIRSTILLSLFYLSFSLARFISHFLYCYSSSTYLHFVACSYIMQLRTVTHIASVLFNSKFIHTRPDYGPISAILCLFNLFFPITSKFY